MTIRLSRPLEYANRFGIQQADQAIKKDIVRALVELITNSDDSYRRVNASGGLVDGRIIVEFERRRRNTLLRVIDFAEGMDDETLDKALGIYAEDTSGFSQGQPVRGYFGRGIKDAILGLGDGEVRGIIYGILHQAWLGIKDGQARYDALRPTPVQTEFLENFGCESGSNATVVEITVSREDVRIPQFDTLRTQLSLVFPLREILNDPDRTVVLRDVSTNGQVRRESRLFYEYPRSEEIAHETLNIIGYDIPCQVVLYRSDVPLDTPREAGIQAQAGFLIKGDFAILDNTLFRFDGDVHAQRFFGSVVCSYLDELLRKNEPVLQATRDGLDRSHNFVRALFSVCEGFLEPFVQEEARRSRIEEHHIQNDRLRQKLSSILSRLNQIAREELAQLDPSGEGGLESPYVPESGFGFVPEYANLYLSRRKAILLRSLVPQIVPEGASVSVSSDNPYVAVLNSSITIECKEEFPWVGEAQVLLEGAQVGAEAIITAECDGITAEALTRVVVREEPNSRNNQNRQQSRLFNEIKFSDEESPRQRVRYDRENHDIIIAIKHSSVSPYITDAGGSGTDSPQGQVILAELVSEAICGAIARRGVETGRFAAPVGGEVEAMQLQQLRLQNLYAGVIHQAIVDPQFRQT